MKHSNQHEGIFQEHRPLLFSIAYRMLGSAMDAEDTVQDSFIDFQAASLDDIRNHKAFLTTILSRRAIDKLKSGHYKREEYIGPWMPEPVVTSKESDPFTILERKETVTTAFLLLLERLSPVERAVFVLRDVFDYDYVEISKFINKSVENCRKISERARAKVKDDSVKRSRNNQMSHTRREKLIHTFLAACTFGETAPLMELLSEDIRFLSDGGGKVSAAINPIWGRDKVTRFFLGMQNKRAKDELAVEIIELNGEPGILLIVNGELDSAITFDLTNDKFQTIYSVRNPEKLSFLKRQRENKRKAIGSFFFALFPKFKGMISYYSILHQMRKARKLSQ